MALAGARFEAWPLPTRWTAAGGMLFRATTSDMSGFLARGDCSPFAPNRHRGPGAQSVSARPLREFSTKHPSSLLLVGVTGRRIARLPGACSTRCSLSCVRQ